MFVKVFNESSVDNKKTKNIVRTIRIIGEVKGCYMPITIGSIKALTTKIGNHHVITLIDVKM